VLPDDLRARAAAERRVGSPFAAPDGEPVFVEGDAVCFVRPDGEVERHPLPELAGCSVLPAGHGILLLGSRSTRLFDLTGRRLVADPALRGAAFAVRGDLVSAPVTNPRPAWQLRRRGGETAALPELDRCRVLGLCDDDHLLVATWPGTDGEGRLRLFRPRARTFVGLGLPAGIPPGASLEVVSPLFRQSSLLPRDADGAIWLVAANATEDVLLALRTATRTATIVWRRPRDHTTWQLLGWPAPGQALLRDGERLVRLDAATRARTVLFPR
jgi:hypothetical protein